ncbi:MAG: thiamine pyrophosphate-binding protein [Anaerolineae bacterium]|nr:thiamine pyrophosphate-binding protein [Anaerolineae bacterium]
MSARHEAAAAHMAEAWARIRGEPGVVIGGIGPGAANMVSGIATAYAEGSPVIAITGQRRRTIIDPDRGGAFQVLDLVDFYRPVTKFAAGLRDWRRLPELLRKAYRMATSGRPGPVYIEIPEDLLRGTGDDADAPIYAPDTCRAGRRTGDPALLAKAAALLAGSKRPLLHAGSGVTWAGAAPAFNALGEHLGAVMTTTLAARGVVPEDHPQYIHILNQDALAAARGEADVVLVVGARLGELDAWVKPPLWGQAGITLIHVDADPAPIGLNRPVDVGIVGDAQAAWPRCWCRYRPRPRRAVARWLCPLRPGHGAGCRRSWRRPCGRAGRASTPGRWSRPCASSSHVTASWCRTAATPACGAPAITPSTGRAAISTRPSLVTWARGCPMPSAPSWPRPNARST